MGERNGNLRSALLVLDGVDDRRASARRVLIDRFGHRVRIVRMARTRLRDDEGRPVYEVKYRMSDA